MDFHGLQTKTLKLFENDNAFRKFTYCPINNIMNNHIVPEISIIIPNLNSSIVDRTVQSIFDQVVSVPFEVLVVGLDKNNHLGKYSGKITHINTGSPVPPGKARNIGVKNSKGNLLVFIDSDAVAQPQFLSGHYIAHKKKQKLNYWWLSYFP